MRDDDRVLTRRGDSVLSCLQLDRRVLDKADSVTFEFFSILAYGLAMETVVKI